jgi:hypothetical protein
LLAGASKRHNTPFNMKRRYLNEVTASLAQSEGECREILTEADLEHLPERVRQYIRYSGAVGKPKVTNLKAEFTGRIRKSEQSPWMPFRVEQYSFFTQSTRLFWMDAVMMHLPVKGFHCFKQGRAFMDIRLLGLIRVQYMDGKEMGIAETVTFFNDMCVMAPGTLTDRRIKWLRTEGSRVLAEFSDHGVTISAWLHFGEDGELTNFTSGDLFEFVDGKMIQRTWQTPVSTYHEIGGHRLGKNADLVYTRPEGDFCYGKFEMTDLHFL